MNLPEVVQAAVYSGPMPVIRNWRNLPNEELTRAEKNMRFCEAHLVVPEGNLVGKPIRLATFQEAFFYSVFDNPAGTKKAILSMARKNSKTATLACILLCFIVGVEAKQNSRVNSGALSRQQAAEVFNYASKMVQLSPTLPQYCRIVLSLKKIVGLPMNVEYTALSAEGKTNHGGSAYVAILDETGQIKGPHDEFVEAITTGQGAYDDAMLFVISTQAATDGDLLSIWIDDAKRAQDPRTVCHVYTAPEDCDLMDREAWQAANPALGLFRSIPDVEEQAKQASRMPSSEASFRWLFLNQRIDASNPFISRGEWMDCADTNIDFSQFKRAGCWAGLDLSQSRDLTALVLAFRDAEGNIFVKPTFWLPFDGIKEKSKADRVPYDTWADQGNLRLCNGATIDPVDVVRTALQYDEEYSILKLGFDPWRIADFERELNRMDAKLPMVKFGQGLKDMSPALDKLERVIAENQFKHPSNPVLNMCFANAVTYTDSNYNRKLDKKKASGRIDGAVATAMAVGVMDDGGKSYLENEGLMIL